MKIQLHWQERKNHANHKLVAQTTNSDQLNLYEWSEDIINRRAAECPEGWGPMICDERYELFILSMEDGEF